MRNAGLEEAQAGIKIARRNINYLRYADDTTLMAESEEELKSLLKNPEMGSHSLLQGIFPTQGLNLGLPHHRQILYYLSHQGSPKEMATTPVFLPGNITWTEERDRL